MPSKFHHLNVFASHFSFKFAQVSILSSLGCCPLACDGLSEITIVEETPVRDYSLNSNPS
jgi:hypothetical protein